MSEFEKFIEDNFKELKSRIESGNFFAKTMKDSMHATWLKQQSEIDQLKAQLINMEQCYIENKKQVEAANTVLINWQDEYTEHTHQHECTTDAVLRTCIAELRQALRGEHE